MTIQATKDTFYRMLQERIAAGNSGRTVVIRGTLRPGVLVSENELPGAAIDGIAPAEAFCLRWTGLAVEAAGALPLVRQTCEIRYASDGSTGMFGIDRGRALAAMDVELATALLTPPLTVAGFSPREAPGGGASAPQPTGGNVFWGDLAYKPAVMRGERMERTAEVEVYSYGN